MESPSVHSVREQAPQGTVEKFVLPLHDGLEVETVHLPMGRGRSSLCVSTQVGCAMGCSFCETGRMGFLRNLSSAEIVDQLRTARARGHDPRTIVFQGMGEALDNYDALIPALRTLNRDFGFSFDRLTVCSVGHAARIRDLRNEGLGRLQLSVSLNAADDGTRARIMPIARRFPLDELQDALAAYRMRKNFALGVHWCLLPGINDDREQVARLEQWCTPLGRVLVHLIPYNPQSQDPITRSPSEAEIVRFVGWLRDEGLAVRRRMTKGRSVMAACGQLGNLELRRR